MPSWKTEFWSHLLKKKVITSRQKKTFKKGSGHSPAAATVVELTKMNVIILQAIFPLEKTCSAYFQKQNWGVNPQKKPSLEVFCKTINTEDSIICSFPTLLLLLLQSTWALSWLKHIYLLKLISWCSHQNSALRFTRKNVKFGMTLIHKTHIFMWNLFTFVITSIMNLE